MFAISPEKLLWDLLKDDMQTLTHCRRVEIYALELCKELELSSHERYAIGMAAALHDIGKCRIPQQLLRKKGKLTEEEYGIVKQHAVFSSKILGDYPDLEDILPYITHHHERVDGKGYPDGIASNTIPYGAKIIAIADAFDAMTAGRPYCQSKSFQQALDEISLHRGTQFVKELADIFIDMMAKNFERNVDLNR